MKWYPAVFGVWVWPLYYGRDIFPKEVSWAWYPQRMGRVAWQSKEFSISWLGYMFFYFFFLPCAYFWDPVLFQHIPSCHPSLEGALSVCLLGAHLILPAPLLEMLTTTSFSSEGLAPAWHTVRTQQALTVFYFYFLPYSRQSRSNHVEWLLCAWHCTVICPTQSPETLPAGHCCAPTWLARKLKACPGLAVSQTEAWARIPIPNEACWVSFRAGTSCWVS